MKRICSFVFMFFLLTVVSFAETDVNKIVAGINKDFDIFNSKRNVKIENNLGTGTYTTYNLLQNDNIKKLTLGHYKNNTETYEEYYIKDNKVNFIFTEKTLYSFDNTNKNTMKIEKEVHKYYFDGNQKLVRYIAPDEKIYDMDMIPNNAKEKSEELKKNIKIHLNEENSKDVMAEMKKEFDDTNKEMMKKFDEMKKEMEDFFEKF